MSDYYLIDSHCHLIFQNFESCEQRDFERARAITRLCFLNIKSPIARALIGKDEGDSVEVKTPGGEKAYEILKIEYK